MKNKLIAVMVIFVLAVTQISSFAFADMEEERLAWALEAVETMAEKGVIKGYEDGTFKPDKSITKEEALLLMSRISGFYEETSEQYKLLANEKYETVLDSYSTNYKDEVSYLLYRGVINIDDLPVYVADDKKAEPLKRYEAAVLLAKLMAADVEDADVDFADVDEIPEDAAPYVAYVSQQELMNGVGENRFEPMTAVTRAQIATILYRAMNKLDYTYVMATLSDYNFDNDIVTVELDGTEEKYVITADIPVALDGSYATLGDVKTGAEVRLTFSGDKIVFVDAITPDYEETLHKAFVKFEKMTDAIVVTVKDPITAEKERYPLVESPVITKNGGSSSITALKTDDYLVIDIVNGKITKIAALTAEKTVLGVVKKISLDEDFSIAISVDGVVSDYKVYDNVSVRRDNKPAVLADLLVGDKVTVTTKYNIVSKIAASSTTNKLEGTIVEIRISKQPSIIIDANGTKKEYVLLNDLKVEKNGEDVDIYALRLGDMANVTLESETVTKISVTSIEEGAYITGKIEFVNTAYGYIKLQGIEEIVFINKAKFQTSAGASLTNRNVTEGKTVIVFGTKSIGAYEATLVIVN